MASVMLRFKDLFYPTLWRKNMARFWPIWAVYFIGWFLALPMELWNGNYRRDLDWFAVNGVLSWAAEATVVVTFLFALLSAMAVYSYLYQAKSAGMIHALPVRREGLYLTSYVSGLSLTLLPMLAVALITALAEAAAGCFNGAALGYWVASQLCCILFFFSFASFCAMFTGHILALPAFYGILNFLAAVVEWLVDNLFISLLFGYTRNADFGQAALWLTPVVNLARRVGPNVEWSEGGRLLGYSLDGMGLLALYAAVGLLFAAAGYAVYHYRHLENAGDVVAVGWVRPIFKYGVAFCCALCLGMFLYEWVLGGSLQNGMGLLIPFILICGAVGYFVAEMLLRKSFRVGRSWKGCAVFTAVLLCLCLTLDFDLFGYEKYVPNPQLVLSATVNAPIDSATDLTDSAQGGFLGGEDLESRQLVARLHQAIVDRQTEIENGDYTFSASEGEVDGYYVDYLEEESYMNLWISYTQPSGSLLERHYDPVPLSVEDMDDPDSPTAILNELLNRPGSRRSLYFDEHQDQARLVDATLAHLTWDQEKQTFVESHIPIEAKEELLAAVKADLDAGRLGRRWLLQTADYYDTNYRNVLEFTFDWRESPNGAGPTAQTSQVVKIRLQKGAAETMKVLEKYELTGNLETCAQFSHREHGLSELQHRVAEQLGDVPMEYFYDWDIGSWMAYDATGDQWLAVYDSKAEEYTLFEKGVKDDTFYTIVVGENREQVVDAYIAQEKAVQWEESKKGR